MVRASLEDRFWPKVREAAADDLSPNGMAGCWLWTASVQSAGYGQINEGGDGRPLLAHRVAYAFVVGTPPRFLDHQCDRRTCVNPAHLVPTTTATNTQRGQAAKLTSQQVREARATFAAGGVTVSDLARRYGVTHEGMRGIVRRTRWRDV